MKLRHRRLRTARKAAGFSYKEAAEITNKSISALKSWEWENGHDPRLVEAGRICERYGITLDWYVFGRQPRTPLVDLEQRLLAGFERLSVPAQEAVLYMVETLAGEGDSAPAGESRQKKAAIPRLKPV